MPSRRHYSNTATRQQTSGSINSTDATVSISGSFANWPVSLPYTATLDIDTVSEECVLVTAVTGTTATITRGYDNTTAISHPAGATLDCTVGRIDFDEANAHTSASAAVHGVTGSVVGTTDTQTLSSKTLASPVFSGTASGTFHTSGNIHTDGDANVDGDLNLDGALTIGDLAIGSEAQLSFGAGLVTTSSYVAMLPATQDFTSAEYTIDAANGKITVGHTGTYEVSGLASFGLSSAGAGTVQLGIHVNGSPVYVVSAGLDVALQALVLPPRLLNNLFAADIVTLRWRVTGGGAVTSASAPNSSFLRIRRVA